MSAVKTQQFKCMIIVMCICLHELSYLALHSSLVMFIYMVLYTTDCFKGLVHPKMKIVIDSPSCHPKPVRPPFIFATQFKIF